MTDAVFVHPTAVVDEPLSLGPGVQIWHFCHLSAGVTIGAHTKLGQNVFVGKDVYIGEGVKIQNNVSVYTGVRLEADVFVGPSVVFTNVIRPRAFLEQKDNFKPTLVERGATIGANATVICGITIGAYAFVAAGSVVTHSVPAFALVKGNPARHCGWVSKAAQTLIFDAQGRAQCPQGKDWYCLSPQNTVAPCNA